MRLLAISPPVHGSDFELPDEAVVSHDVRNPRQRTEVLVRKGTRLERAQLAELIKRIDSPDDEVHLAVPEPGDMAEDEAAVRVATAVSGAGVQVGEGRFGQVTLTSAARGMLRVNPAVLERLNALDGVLVLTSLPEVPTDAHTPLGVVKCAPLFLSAAVMEAVEAIGASCGPVLEVQRFRSLRVAFVAPTGRVRGNAFQRAAGALSHALEWYGSSLAPTIATDITTLAVAQGYRAAVESRVDLILAAGASGTDPADVVFEGLRQAGGKVVQIGIPAEPGTACWIGELASTPVLGLASCELFGQPGALDLLLPRLLVGEALDRALLRRIALGGLLVGGPTRVAPYHHAER